MNNKALIFGVGGFVGPYLTKELQSYGYEVFGMDSKDCEAAFSTQHFFKGNILNKETVKKIIRKIMPTQIVNLAAISSVEQSWKIPNATMQINVGGTLTIFNACLELNIKPKILLIGSSEEYVSCEHPIDENTPLSSNNPYGISKIAQEQFAKIYREKYNWNIFYVRAFNHTGIGQKPSFVIPNWCKQVANIEKGTQKPIIQVGNLDVSRDFTNVKDIVRAYRLVLESNDSSQIYNIGSGNAYSLRNLLNQIVSLSSKKIKIERYQEYFRANDNKVICCNNSKLVENLKWYPRYSISNTIEEIFNHFLKG